MVVNDYLESQFEPIMDYNFTANVERSSTASPTERSPGTA